MSTKIICDVCGEELPPVRQYYRVTYELILEERSPLTLSDALNSVNRKADLCSTCSENMVTWLRNQQKAGA